MNFPLTAEELDMPATELASRLVNFGYPAGTLLFQGELTPADFVGFSITVISSQDAAVLCFLSLDSDARRLVQELKRVKGTDIDGQVPIISSNSSSNYSFVPWEELVSLSQQSIDDIKRNMELLNPFALSDAKSISTDGITLRGKVIKLGGLQNDFFAFSPLVQRDPAHYQYFQVLLRAAINNLREELSLACLNELERYFSNSLL